MSRYCCWARWLSAAADGELWECRHGHVWTKHSGWGDDLDGFGSGGTTYSYWGRATEEDR